MGSNATNKVLDQKSRKSKMSGWEPLYNSVENARRPKKKAFFLAQVVS